MEVILKVVDGPEVGKEFHFDEADNFLIGRKDPTSQAHLQISPEDRFVSRNHFIIEIRPPNVMIRDNQSTNGTFVRSHGKTSWSERIDEVLVNDGDEIKIGHTIMSIAVIQPQEPGLHTYIDSSLPVIEIHEDKQKEKHPSPEPQPELKKHPVEPPKWEPEKQSVQPRKQEPAKPEYSCIRCGAALDKAPLLPTGGVFREELFMCEKCLAEVANEHEQEAERRAAVQYKCHHCGSDVTKAANSDGRAAEFGEIALYLCKSCADRAAKLRMAAIGDYRALSELGRGGMGVVYKAWHIPSGRLAALKQMLPIAKANDILLRRFYRETLINQQLRHPALVRLYEAGLEGDEPYFISEFVPDGNLNKFMSPDDRPLLEPAQVARVIADSLEGLESIHAKGFVHRDLKPENILLRELEIGVPGGKSKIRYQPKLADFGLSRSYERHGGTITRKGEYAGTIFYMPSEQIIAFKEAHPPVDVYAMGVTLYYLLTGRFSLDFPSPAQLKRGAMVTKDPIRMILEDQPRPVRSRRPDLPAALCTIVDRAVAKDATNRYQTASEFRKELLKFIGA